MRLLEVLAVVLAVPGAVAAVGGFIARRASLRRAGRARKSELDIRVRLRIRRR